MVKLQRTVRTYRGREVVQWSVTVPKAEVERLGWKAGQALDVVRSAGGLRLQVTRPEPEPTDYAPLSLFDQA